MTPDQLERRRAAKTKWRKNNPEKHAAAVQAWHAKPENQKRVSERMAAWYQRTINVRRARTLEYAKNHREQERKRIAKWCRANPEKKRVSRMESNARRHAIKVGAEISTDRTAYKAFLALMKSDARIPCYWCGKKTEKGNRHADHVIPLAKNGKDDVHNLCCSCAICNLSKHDSSPEKFSGQHHFAF